MSEPSEFRPDWDRRLRVGIEEAVLCQFKSVEQIEQIVSDAASRGQSQLLTRLTPEVLHNCSQSVQSLINYEVVSRTGIVGEPKRAAQTAEVGIVTAGPRTFR